VPADEDPVVSYRVRLATVDDAAAIYAKHGFRTVGIYEEQGQLDGRWVDTIVMEGLL
jgi:L-amino acid N-acyltransferase YncA